MRTKCDRRGKPTGAHVGYQRWIGLAAVLLTALVFFHTPAYAQTDAHEAEITLELNEDRFRIAAPNLLPPGPTMFSITNHTDVTQGLAIIGEAIEPTVTEPIAPSESYTLELDLGEGIYLLHSTTFEYAVLGMETTFYVTDERINPARQDDSEVMTGTTALEGSGNLLVTAAENDFTTFADVAALTGLTETLQGDGPYTIFVPTNEAFATVPQDTLDKWMAEPDGFLSEILRYHVVEGDVRAADLEDGQILQTLQGDELVVDVTGTAVQVGDATVVTADIEADNGIIHAIDSVLLPVVAEDPNADVSEATGAPAMADSVEGDEVVPGDGLANDDDGPGVDDAGDTIPITGTATMTGTDVMTGTGVMTSAIVLQTPQRTITQAEFNNLFMRALREFAAQTGLPLNPTTLPIFEELRSRFLVQLALQEALLAEANARGLEVKDSQIENVVLNARQNYASDEEFQQALTNAGYADEAAFREAIRTNALLGMVMDDLRSELNVTDEEIADFYAEHQDRFRIDSDTILPLEEVEGRIRTELINEKLNEQIGTLQEDAQIEIFAGNLDPLIDVLTQQLPTTDGSDTNGDSSQ